MEDQWISNIDPELKAYFDALEEEDWEPEGYNNM